MAREDRDPCCLEPAGECAGARDAVKRQDGGVRRRRRIVARELIGLLDVKRTRILASLHVLLPFPTPEHRNPVPRSGAQALNARVYTISGGQHDRQVLLPVIMDHRFGKTAACHDDEDWVSIDDLDLEIHFVKENVVLSPDSRSTEKFIHGIRVLMAKNYIDNLGEEVSKGLREKAEPGLWPSFAPLGYVNAEGPDHRRLIVPDPDRAPLVTKLFEWYATGDYSLKEVGRMARQAGFTFRKSGAPIPTATAHRILRKRIYTGDFEWKGRIFPGTHPAIVSREMWQRVQDVLDGRATKRPKWRRHQFAFSGLIQCGHCGCSMVGETKKASSRLSPMSRSANWRSMTSWRA